MKTILTLIIIAIGGLISMCSFMFGSFVPYSEVDDEMSFSTEDVQEIRVDMSSESIRIYRAESGSEIRFHYYGRSWPARRLVAENTDGDLSVNAPGVCFMGDLRLDVYLPADYHGALAVDAASGSVSMEAVDLADFRLKASSGSFTAGAIKAPSVSIRMASGALKVKSIEAGRLDIDNNSGSIKAGPCICDEASIRTSSGSITLEGVEGKSGITSNSGSITLGAAAGNTRASTDSGSITLRDVRGDTELTTNSGSIRAAYTAFEADEVHMKTSSGSLTLDLPPGSGFMLEARTGSGRVRSDFSVTSKGGTERKGVFGQVGSGAGQVSLTTGSGNIDVNEVR